MYRLRPKFTAFLSGCVALAIPCALPATSAAFISPQALSTPSAAPSIAMRDTGHMRDMAHKLCLDTIFFAALPGKTNYCLGMRDWENGHYASGLELLVLAAGWGNKSAQYTLGLIYFNGHHVAPNRPLGIAWLTLADQRHNDAQIARVARSVDKLATPAERAQAARLYARMQAHYGDRVATARAWRHWDHWQRSHSGNSEGVVCLSGQQLWAVRHAGLAGIAPGVTQALQAAAASRNIKDWKNCVGITLATQQHVLHISASHYFAGWAGVVSVGPLQQVPASAASSGH